MAIRNPLTPVSIDEPLGGSCVPRGDKVVHPCHGAAVVEDLVELERFGEQRIYVKLRLPHGLTLMVPVESTEQIGLRGVVSRDELDEVFDLLRGDEGFMPILWGRRYRANLANSFPATSTTWPRSSGTSPLGRGGRACGGLRSGCWQRPERS